MAMGSEWIDNLFINIAILCNILYVCYATWFNLTFPIYIYVSIYIYIRIYIYIYIYIRIYKYKYYNVYRYIQMYTVRHKILTRENIDEFDKFSAICQYFPYQNFPFS